MKKNISWATWGVAFIAFFLPWQTRWIYGVELLAGDHTEYGIMSVFVVEFLVVIVLIGLLVTRQKVAKRNWFILGLGAVLCALVIFGSSFAQRGAFSLAMATHVIFAFMFFALILFEAISIRRLALVFVLGLVPSVVFGALQVVSGGSAASTILGIAARDAGTLGDAVFTVDGERVLRAYGSFSHPNVLGGYLGVGLFAWWYALSKFRSKWSLRTYATIGTLGTVFLLFGLVLSGSRSAMLGLAVGLVAMVFVRIKRCAKYRTVGVVSILLVAIVGSLFASFALPGFVADLRGGGVHEERSLQERVVLYQEFVPFILETNPIVGRGVGQYVLSYADFDPGKPSYDYQPVHNSLLLFFAETGFLGLLAVISFFVAIARKHLSRLSKQDSGFALGMVTVIILITFYDHYLWSSWAGLALCAFALGMMTRLGEE